MKALLVLLFVASSAFANDVPSVREDAKRIVSTLASRTYWGRGYTRQGMAKAADFLVREIESIGLQPLDGKAFRQPFELPVNTFPGRMVVYLNDRLLVPGEDYIVSPGSAGGRFVGKVTRSGDDEYKSANGRVVVNVKDKLTWSVSTKKLDRNLITIDRKKVLETPSKVEFEIAEEFIPNFRAENITAVVPGTLQPERVILFTAHYDHLGGMGDRAFFPGANDNASGVSLLLSLAKYYSTHPQPYSIGFIFFAAEEAGLVGSKYFVEHPLIDLKSIRFVMNFDLVGTGEKGATVVNATEFPREFAILKKLNAEGGYLPQIGSRGKAPNSDHYWFSEHGVPAFFLYTMGGIQAYHDIYDRSETLPLDKIDDVFALTLKFGQKLAEEGLTN